MRIDGPPVSDISDSSEGRGGGSERQGRADKVRNCIKRERERERERAGAVNIASEEREGGRYG